MSCGSYKEDLVQQFTFVGASAFVNSHYGAGKGPVFLNSVRCTGTENSLTDCSRSLFGDVSSSCATHLYDASVKCPVGKSLQK